ncbi:TIR domain-containing protein [Pectinatus frisingensis]|nr:TIR domain-containing protein [Pectinatus frisingensis]
MEPLAVVFVWNKEDNEVVQKYINYASDLLTRNLDNPFSRNLDLPIFYYTSTDDQNTPPTIPIKAEKVITYVFIGKNSVASNHWEDYINKMVENHILNVIPIALDKTAFNIGSISTLNYIREYEYKENKQQQFFISLAHEIYRLGFNEERKDISTNSSLKIFLSHAKDDKNGINATKQLKQVIDESTMSRFFDASDIAPGYRFDEEIINNIKESSIIIVNSDIYSTRYWCQREIQASKEFERPIIEVDLIQKGMDRKFPYAGNIPVVRADIKNDKIGMDDLYRILEMVLIETIRYNYINIKLNDIQKNIKVRVKRMSRPPEMFDLQKIIKKDGDTITLNYDDIIYPDPPIYSEEIDFFRRLGIKIYTPVEMHPEDLSDKNIGMSISNPDDSDLKKIGQNDKHLKKLAQIFSKYLLGSGASLIYGGDLRKDGFTEKLILEAQILKDRLKSHDIHIKNYLAWPIYLNDSDDVKKWKAEYKGILAMINVNIGDKVENMVTSKDKFLFPDSETNCYIWSQSLTKMRETMIGDCNARICAGGKDKNYKGKMPGVLEEIIIASEKKLPIYLLGGFGGIVHSVCDIIENNHVSDNLSLSWQIENNVGYRGLLDLYKKGGEKISYIDIVNKIKNIKLNNGLSRKENIQLFNTVYFDEAVLLVLKGLQSL